MAVTTNGDIAQHVQVLQAQMAQVQADVNSLKLTLGPDTMRTLVREEMQTVQNAADLKRLREREDADTARAVETRKMIRKAVISLVFAIPTSLFSLEHIHWIIERLS